MAKGKTANPADAFRKAQRKKELKKNKTERAKARDFSLVKKDTRDVEEEIEKLEGLSERSAADNSRLTQLKGELEKINKKKEEYVAEHPEHRKLVFKSRRAHDEDRGEGESKKPEFKSRNLFNKKGLPRHPERSIYYDPVMNPYGVAPPGMPYMERPLRPDEIDSGAEDQDDEDIVMPEGPPPDQSDGSDEDIPMPEGPPPPKDGLPQQPSLPPTPGPSTVPPPPTLPAGFVPPGFALPPGAVSPPTPPPGFPPSGVPLPPPPLPVNMSGIPPPPPPGFPPSFGVPFPPQFMPQPPPPPGFPPSGMPPPPPGFFPRRGVQSVSSMQDPLSSTPHQTYQAHRASRDAVPPPPSLHPSLPSKPRAPISSAAVVSAEPELRDFKKESTAFVPTTLKRKKAGAGSAAPTKVNAAPSLAPSTGEEESTQAPRPDLLSALKSQFGTPSGETKSTPALAAKPKDDYEKFVEEMGDILGPPS
ncbi:unnamed protein product [Somion occarium]|uniref:Wbp11/ELF5/Saf1 N-terminal domain-containing protein n=1 Tax=Somion occarium TaxID=3059160 RepID=A0ABP1CHB4_9APHY